MNTDVLIIGAGVHGASAAFHLTQRGAKVTVLERSHAAGGPTGRSSAVVRAYYTNEFLARVARDSITMFESFADLTDGGDAGFHRTGALWLHGTDTADAATLSAANLNGLGVACDLLSVDDVRREHPRFSADDLGLAVWEQNAGYADPVGTTTGMLNAAISRGAQYRSASAVAEIQEDAASVRVRTGSGEWLEAAQLLIAAGPWTKPLAAQVGVDLPLTVERHIVATFAFASAPRLSFAVSDTIQGFYVKPEGADHFLMGPLLEEPQADPENFDEKVGEDESLALATKLVGRIPDLDETAPTGGWASLYDVSPDWQPVIGQIGERTFVDAGTSGHGFKLAPALGGHVAGMILGEEPDEGLAAFSPERFGSGELLAAGYGRNRLLG